MARIPDSVIEEIKNRINLAELIQSMGINLRRTGRDWRGACPFEPGSKNPTKFRVSPLRFECFGCGQAGDVFVWLKEREGVSFRDALEHAARLVGVDLSPYESASREVTPEERRKQAQRALVSDLAQLSFETLLSLPEDARIWKGVEISSLAGSGDIGFMPSLAEIESYLQKKGHSPEIQRNLGLERALPGLADGWVLWGRYRGRISAGRPLGKQGPAIGVIGRRSGGWLEPSSAFFSENGERAPLIVEDDQAYLALRLMGIEGLYRPIGSGAMRMATRMATFGNKERPPIMLALATRDSRRNAFTTALQLLPANPRLRVGEIFSVADWFGDPEKTRRMLSRILVNAGMVIDWQGELLARYNGLETDEDRQRAAVRLSQIVDAMPPSVEKEACLEEVKWLTGSPPLLQVGGVGDVEWDPGKTERSGISRV